MAELERVYKEVNGQWTWVTQESSGGGGSQTVESATVEITSAQLLALDVTPKIIVPAAGGRMYHVVLGLDLHYRFVTTPYNESMATRLRLGYGSTVAAITTDGLIAFPLSAGSGVPAAGLFQQSADFYVPSTTALSSENINTNMFAATFVENKAIGIALQAEHPLTGGDGTLSVTVFYSTKDGAS